jgi:hypothetical protein
MWQWRFPTTIEQFIYHGCPARTATCTRCERELTLSIRQGQTTHLESHTLLHASREVSYLATSIKSLKVKNWTWFDASSRLLPVKEVELLRRRWRRLSPFEGLVTVTSLTVPCPSRLGCSSTATSSDSGIPLPHYLPPMSWVYKCIEHGLGI